MRMLNLKVVPEIKRGRGRPALSEEERAARKQAKLAAEEQAREVRALALHNQAVEQSGNPVDQAVAVLRSSSRLSALFGLALGAFVPLASYTIIHVEVKARPELWVLVGACLLFSAFSVFGWARQAFDHTFKALGFVVLLEGVLMFSRVAWLSLSGLVILMVLNGVTAAVTLQKRRRSQPVILAE
jgi:VIT1/CCC1 family predicted Fe2+/Mn2+ transporter